MNSTFNDLIQALKNLPSTEGAALVKEYHKQSASLPPVSPLNIRMYSSAKQSRLTSGWGQLVTSADSELLSSLRVLRSRSRALIRDAAYAKRAKIIVVKIGR